MKKTCIRSLVLCMVFLAHLHGIAAGLKNTSSPPCTLSVNAGADKTICEGSNTLLQPTVTGGTAPYTYSWSGGPLSSSTKSNPVASPTNGTSSINTTSYTLTVTDAGGCVVSDVVVVSVVPNVQLLSNGNFESVTAPATERGQVENASGWKKVTGDGDLFDIQYTGCDITISPLPTIGLCNTSPLDYNCVGIPCNHFGYQDVNKPGSSYYAGLWAGVGKIAAKTAQPPTGNELDIAVEGIEIPIGPLVTGVTYRLSFYIVKAEKGEVENVGVTPYASYKIKMNTAATTAANPADFKPVNGTLIYESSVSDSKNWQEVTYVFTATDNFTHMIIESAIDSLLIADIDLSRNPEDMAQANVNTDGIQSYFFIDDISLKYECVADTLLVADAGENDTICRGSWVTLGGSPSAAAGTPPYTYYWSSLSGFSSSLANPAVSPFNTTTYTLTVTDNNGLVSTDNVTITVSGINYDAGAPSYTQCPGVPTLIGGTPNGGIAPYTYSWSPNLEISATNIERPTVTPTVNRTYVATVTDAVGCTRQDLISFNIITPPVATAKTDTTICQGQAVTLTGKGDKTGPYIFRWNGGVGDSTLAVAPGSTTMYVLEIEDERGCKGKDTVTVTVNQRPVISATDKNFCSGSSGVLIGAPATGGLAPYSYSWTNGLSNQATHNVTPASTTSYTVVATDARQCVSDSKTINVRVKSSPIANAGRDRTICQTVGSTLLGAVHVGSGEAGFTYSWFPRTSLNNHTLARPTVSNRTTDTIYTVTVTNAEGCSATDSMRLTVNVCASPGEIGTGGNGNPGCSTATMPDANAGNDINACNGSSVTLGAITPATNGTPPYTYSWSCVSGPAFSSALARPVVTFTNDRRVYKLIVTDACGRTSDDYITVSVYRPTLPKNGNTEVCSGQSVAIGNPATGGSPRGGISYSWTASPAPIPSGTPRGIASPAVNTTYVLTATDMFGCNTKDTIVVAVNALPSVNAGSDTSFCSAGDSVVIGNFATGGTPGYTYSWVPQRGLASTVTARPKTKPLVTTEYTVRVTDSKGCKASDNVTVFVSESPYISAGPSVTMCEGSSVILGGNPASKGTAPYTYNWSPSTGLSGTNWYSTSANPAVTTTYTLRATDAVGCTKDTTVTVTVNPTPVADAGPDKAICAGDSVTIGLPATISSGTVTYFWSPSYSLNNSSAAMPKAFPPFKTTYTVSVRSDKNCWDYDAVEVQVFQTPEYVPNQSFEDVSGTPTGRDEVPRAYGWDKATGTPDLFDQDFTGCDPIISPLPSTCGLSPLDYNCVGVPCNHFGYQYSNTGYRHTGLYSAFGIDVAGRVHVDTTIYAIQRFAVEGIQVKLNQPLTPNRQYTISFWASRAEKGETGDNLPATTPDLNSENILVSDLAPFSVKFSKDFVQDSMYRPVDRQVYFTGVVSDTSNWVHMTGTFTPNDAYEYLIIESDPSVLRYVAFTADPGRFRSTDYMGNNTYVPFTSPADLNITLGTTPYPYTDPIVKLQSYLYVDDVSIREVCDVIPPLVVDAGNDTSVCEGRSVTLGGAPTASFGTPGYTYSWLNTSTWTVFSTATNPVVTPLTTTTYRLTVTDAASVVKVDYVTVTVFQQDEYITNGEFEAGTKPLGRAQIEFAPAWFKATGDADLYDSAFDCAPVPYGLTPADYNCVDIPQNHFGYQHIRSTGQRYAGLWSLIQLSSYTTGAVQPRVPPIEIEGGSESGVPFVVSADPDQTLKGAGTNQEIEGQRVNHTLTTQVAVEGIEIKLDQPLQTDRYYLLSFYVSKAELGETGDNITQLPSVGDEAIDTKHLLVDSCAGFHIKLSKDSITNILYQPVDAPVLHGGQVCDTSQWQLYYHIFKPTENSNYLIIESYPTNGAMQAIATASTGVDTRTDTRSLVAGFQSYFYIDDVSLTEMCNSFESISQQGAPQQATEQAFGVKAKDAPKQIGLTQRNINAEPFSMQIAPNPNSGAFTLQYSLGEAGYQNPEIILYDAIGKELQRIRPDYTENGRQSLQVDIKSITGDAIGGMYFVRLVNGGESIVKKISVVH